MRDKGLLVAGWLNAVSVVFGAGFTELQLHPGNGVATNVPSFGGAVNVVVNPGSSGGGIVTLNPANSYYGSTTLGCGTLVAEALADGFSASSLGASSASVSNLVLRNGTLRYRGGSASTDRGYTVNVDPANANYAAVLQADGDITFRGNVSTLCGNFLKSGTGTVTYASAGSNQFSRGASIGLNAVINFKTNGDCPTTGYSGFNVTAGKVVFGANATQTNYFTSELIVGLPTTIAAGQETPAYVDFVGGVNYLGDWLGIGRGNGTTTTAPAGLASKVAIYSGYVRVNNLSMGYSAGISGYNARPVLDVFGGTLDIVSAMRIGDHAGGHPTLNLYGGTTKAASYISGIYGATDARINMYSNAVLEITGSCNLASNSGTSCTLALHGGTFKARGVFARSSGTTAKVYFNGGRFMARASGGEGVGPSVQAVVSTNGAVFDTQSYTLVVYPPLTHDAALSGTADAGLVKYGSGTLVLGAANTYTGPTRIYSGKVALGLAGSLPATSDLTLASGASLAITNTSQTVASLALGTENGDATSVALGVVKGVTLISSGVFTNLNDSPLSVSLFESAGSSSPLTTPGTYTVLTVPLAHSDALNALRVTLANAASGTVCTFSKTAGASTASLVATVAAAATVGDVWTNPAGGDWATGSNWQGGTPVDAAGATATFSTESQEGGATVSLASGVTVGGLSFSAVNGYTLTGSPLAFNNGSASSDVSVTFGSNTLASAVGFAGPAVFSTTNGSSITVSGALTGQDEIDANPAARGGGTVAFNNASGFTGRLATGCGRTVIDSLAFVKDPADLVLGPGTLRYTGSGETIPGLTVNSGSARGSVLAIDNDLTMLSCSLGTGLFIKSGPGTLTFAGTGTFRLGNTSANYDINDLTGYPANGDSASTGIQSALIAKGKIVIGAAGDAANAPVIVAGGDFWTGTHTTATNVETTGELVMNNGVLTVGSTFGAGYYNGDTNTAPQGLAPKVTINGGTINSASLMLGWDYRGIQTCRPELTLNGGTVNVAGTFGLGANAGLNATNTFILNGGTLNAKTLSCGLNKSGSMTNSPAYIYLNGGVVNLTEDLQLARYSSESYLYLNEGATLCARNINSGGGMSEAHFNGGVVRPTGSMSDITRAYIGEKGLILDTGAYPTNTFNANNAGWCELTQSLATDPVLNGATDGGIIKRGAIGFCMRPTYAFTFKGPVCVEEGLFGLQGSAVCDKEVDMLPGTSLRASNQDQWIGSLVLGAEGAETPVILDTVDTTAGYGYVVSNDLSVLSPVHLGMHPGGNTAGCMSMVNGPHTALVYRASCDTNVDVAKFSIVDGFPTKSGAVAKVDITGGAYADWKAIVMTVSDNPNPSSTAWVSTSVGGAWGTGANWDGGTVPESKRDALVAFNPAAAANVPVNVDAPVTLGNFALTAADPASGYAFSGQAMTVENTDNVNPATITVNSGDHTLGAPINDPWVANTSGDADSIAVATASGATARVTGAVSCLGALRVNKAGSGGGTTILSGANTYKEGLNVRSGTAVIESWNEAGVAGPLGLSVNPTIGPGTFHYRGPDAATARGLTLNAGSNSRTCIIRTDHDLTVSGVFNSTNGGFVKTGPGTLRLANTGTNKLCTAGDASNWNSLKNWPNNGDSPVPTSQTGFGAAMVDEGELVIGAPGQVMNYATSGSCDMFVGAQTRGWTYTTNAATLTVLDGLFNCNKWLYIGHCFVRSYDAVTKSYAPTYATYNQYGGTVNLETFAMAYDLGPYNHSCQAVANLYGGQMNISSVFRFGQTYNKTGINPPHATINLYGGVINHYNNTTKPYGAHMGYYSNAGEGSNALKRACDATLNLYGGEFRDVQRIYMGANASTSALNLHGGKVVCENIFLQNTATGTDYDFFAGGKAYLYWNGGEYWPLGSNSANRTFGGLTQVTVSTNGAVIDTTYLPSNAVYTVSQALEHDAALAGADGGFTKRGAGTLALSGVNTFSGWTTVEGGALRMRSSAALSSNVNVKAGAALDMDGTAYDVANLAGAGAASNGTTRMTGVFTIGETNGVVGASFAFANATFANGSTVKCDTTADGATHDAFLVRGALKAEGVVNLDFGRTEEKPLSKTFRIKLAEFGTCEGIRFRGVNIGLPSCTLQTLIENRAVYVTLVSNGTTLLLR